MAKRKRRHGYRAASPAVFHGRTSPAAAVAKTQAAEPDIAAGPAPARVFPRHVVIVALAAGATVSVAVLAWLTGAI